ncbi:MAG TPA: BACON domain-containing protein [Bacteroides reticulotermitis]|nr:BACON domain-containing protein [Bacteroides reticulotermitis]
MKIKLLLFLPLLTFLMMGCGDSDTDTAALSVSRSSFNDMTPENTAVGFTITCNSTWNISSDQAWCVPSVLSGTNNTDLSLLISANTTTESRSATVSIVFQKDD